MLRCLWDFNCENHQYLGVFILQKTQKAKWLLPFGHAFEQFAGIVEEFVGGFLIGFFQQGRVLTWDQVIAAFMEGGIGFVG